MAIWNQRIKELRIKHGLTQQDIGDLLGVNRSTVANYEQGRREPTMDAISALADTFHVSVDYLTCTHDYDKYGDFIARVDDVFSNLDKEQRDNLFHTIMEIYIKKK